MSALLGGFSKTFARGLAAFALALSLSACAVVLRNPDIADVKQNAGAYSDRTVTVTVPYELVGLFLSSLKMYKVDDGTGEITVLSRGGERTPSRASRVKVKWWSSATGHVNGMPLGCIGRERPRYSEKLDRAGSEGRGQRNAICSLPSALCCASVVIFTATAVMCRRGLPPGGTPLRLQNSFDMACAG